MDWQQLVDQIPNPVTVSVQVYTGQGARGPVYAPAADVDGCVVERRRRRVTTQVQDVPGAVVISSTTVRCLPGTVAPVDSLVTIPGDDAARRVLQRADWDDHGLGLPSHVELLIE